MARGEGVGARGVGPGLLGDFLDAASQHGRGSTGETELCQASPVSGSVNHFGHVHYRQNRYDAALCIRADEGTWKMFEVEILDERGVL